MDAGFLQQVPVRVASGEGEFQVHVYGSGFGGGGNGAVVVRVDLAEYVAYVGGRDVLFRVVEGGVENVEYDG